MKKVIIPVIIALAVISAIIYYFVNKPGETIYKTARVEKGTLVSTVSATGSLAAVVTVSVGTQVSGTIQKLYVDYNSLVKKGQPIAQIDPSLFEAAIEQNRGNHLNAIGSLAKAKATLADAKRTMERNRQLVNQGIVAQSDFDTAQTAYEQALAQVSSAEGVVAQTRGALRQAETNLRYATIRSPVDGIVVSRSIDVGQTVAASFQTPTLFSIAQDLTKMEIDTSVDESDIGRLKLGQTAIFSVDAYPERQFTGTVRQIRNAPVTTQNVVTYVTVISVDNRELLLKPGMTANVTIETDKKDNVLMIPNAALRFRPKTAKGAARKTNAAPASSAAADKDGKRVDKQHVYQLDASRKPVAVTIKTGISNDRFVEMAAGELKEGDSVIVEQVQNKKTQGGSRPPSGPRF